MFWKLWIGEKSDFRKSEILFKWASSIGRGFFPPARLEQHKTGQLAPESDLANAGCLIY